MPIIKKSRPNVVDGGTAQWPSANSRDLSLDPPVVRVFSVGTNARDSVHEVNVTANGFTCSFVFTLVDTTMPAADYALFAVNGSFFCGVIPARACALYRVPKGVDPSKSFPLRSSCTDAAVTNMKSVYDGSLGTVGGIKAQLRAPGPLFETFSLVGEFSSGDLVLPMANSADGAPLDGARISITERGRGMTVRMDREPLLQAMLYSNTRGGMKTDDAGAAAAAAAVGARGHHRG